VNRGGNPNEVKKKEDITKEKTGRDEEIQGESKVAKWQAGRRETSEKKKEAVEST